MASINKKNMKIVTRLIEAGFTTSKQVYKLTLADLRKIPGLNNAEIETIIAFQEAIAGRCVYEFLIETEEADET
jgi:hypothetical protein